MNIPRPSLTWSGHESCGGGDYRSIDGTETAGTCFEHWRATQGAWLEFETSSKDIISVKVDRKRKVSASTFLRALGVADDDEMMAMFADIDTDENHRYMQTTLAKDPVLDPKDLNFKNDDLHSLWEWLHEDKEWQGVRLRE